MLVEGLRVVRGPDWKGDDDGGEGHVGTVTQDNEDDTVEVQWDMGESQTCSTGNGGKYEVRVFDSAPLGLKHDGIICDGCKRENFTGTRWKCSICDDFDLCNDCYMGDSHDKSHPFMRFDAPGMPGEKVPKRSGSRKVTALGIFKGATVVRGDDWVAGNQDGGDGTQGTVIETVNYGSTGYKERDAVKVKWPRTDSNNYRLGYRGKVDLKCVKAAPRAAYYVDHLLPLYTTTLPRRSSRSLRLSQHLPQQQATGGAQKNPGSGQDQQLKEGDKVFVEYGEVELKQAQKGHGGWSMRMKDYIGKVGKLRRFTVSGDCVIDYDDDKQWTFNPAAIKKVRRVFIT